MSQLPPYPGAPRWVKLAVIIGAVLTLVLAIVFAAGIGGPHGPQRHMTTEQIPAQGGQ